MKTIHKFVLAPPFIIPMPANAKVLCVQAVDNYPVMFVELDTEEVYIKRNFMVLGTGHIFPEHVTKTEYISTVQVDGGKVVLHIYEELETNVH